MGGVGTERSVSGVATLAGLGAIVLWSFTIAVARSLAEQLGSIGSAAAVFGVSGLFSLVPLFTSSALRRNLQRLPVRVLFGCGALFLAYMAFLFLAVGGARDRTEALNVGLLNYLWPVLTLLFSVLFLGKRAGGMLVPGTALALAGLVLVLTHDTELTPGALFESLGSNPRAYAFALAAAVAWALYSNLTARWDAGREGSAVLLFLPATGLALGVAAFLVDEERHWSGTVLAEAAFLGVATFLAYLGWDKAMRKGNVVLVAAASYLTPFLSAIVVCLYLGVAPDLQLWAGCAALVIGSLISWRSLARCGAC
jgi:drug/metabolite transporter (DMT)-like permease